MPAHLWIFMCLAVRFFFSILSQCVMCDVHTELFDFKLFSECYRIN